jgi:hypothetical protein
MMNILIIMSLINITYDDYFILVNIKLFSANGIAKTTYFVTFLPRKNSGAKNVCELGRACVFSATQNIQNLQLPIKLQC